MSITLNDQKLDVNEQFKKSYLKEMPSAIRRCPNVILRSSLFGVVAKGGHTKVTRKFCVKTPIETPKGTTIIYTGYQLNQKDLDLWLEILFLASEQKKPQQVKFSTRSMLKELGYKSIGGSSIKQLTNMLERLKVAHLNIDMKKSTDLKGLIGDCKISKTTGDIVVNLNTEIVELFLPKDTWTQVELSHRRKLKSQLAQWLHLYYLTHRNPIPLPISFIQSLSGSEATPSRFKQMLEASFNELRALDWEIEIKQGINDKEEKIHVKHPRPKYVKTIRPAAQVQTQSQAQAVKATQEKSTPKKLPWLEQAKQDARAQRARVAL